MISSVSPSISSRGHNEVDDPLSRRATEFSHLLQQALEQRHDEALQVLLQGAREERAPRFAGLVGEHHPDACKAQRQHINAWTHRISDDQLSAFAAGCEKRETEFRQALERSIQQRDHKALKVLLNQITSSRHRPFFKAVGTLYSALSREDRNLILEWQKQLPRTQHQNFKRYAGFACAEKLKTVTLIAPFLGAKDFLALHDTDPTVSLRLVKNPASRSRVLAAKAARLEERTDFDNLFKKTRELKNPHLQMDALKSLACALLRLPSDDRSSSFDALLNAAEELASEVDPASLVQVLAEALVASPLLLNDDRARRLLVCIERIPSPEPKLVSLEKAYRAVKPFPDFNPVRFAIGEAMTAVLPHVNVQKSSHPQLLALVYAVRLLFKEGHPMSDDWQDGAYDPVLKAASTFNGSEKNELITELLSLTDHFRGKQRQDHLIETFLLPTIVRSEEFMPMFHGMRGNHRDRPLKFEKLHFQCVLGYIGRQPRSQQAALATALLVALDNSKATLGSSYYGMALAAELLK